MYSGGSTKSAGAGCSGIETGTVTGPAISTTAAATTSSIAGVTTTSGFVTTTSAGTPGGCTVAKYGQCGGNGYTGCTTCAVCCYQNVLISDSNMILVWFYMLRCLATILLSVPVMSSNVC